MCLRFVFLLITRVAGWLRLSRREETWKTAEILILRHQLAILQRQQPRRPKLNWADRALLATLLGVIPKARRQRLRLLITPDTILRWVWRWRRRAHWPAGPTASRTPSPPAPGPGRSRRCRRWPLRAPGPGRRAAHQQPGAGPVPPSHELDPDPPGHVNEIDYAYDSGQLTNKQRDVLRTAALEPVQRDSSR